MIQKIKKDTYRVPWASRLPRTKVQDIRHPFSIDEFKNWPDLSPIDACHLSYLESCDKQLKAHWLPQWKEIVAIGLFVNRQRHYESVPFLLITEHENPYNDLIAFSESVADVYLEFGILPDVHVLNPQVVKELDKSNDVQWAKTRRVSISLGRKPSN
jgi:hypothetical protein